MSKLIALSLLLLVAAPAFIAAQDSDSMELLEMNDQSDENLVPQDVLEEDNINEDYEDDTMLLSSGYRRPRYGRSRGSYRGTRQYGGYGKRNYGGYGTRNYDKRNYGYGHKYNRGGYAYKRSYGYKNNYRRGYKGYEGRRGYGNTGGYGRRGYGLLEDESED
eukprot:162008_1